MYQFKFYHRKIKFDAYIRYYKIHMRNIYLTNEYFKKRYFISSLVKSNPIISSIIWPKSIYSEMAILIYAILYNLSLLKE